MLVTSIRRIAPPVKPVGQDTAFVENDSLLITENGDSAVVTVERVSVADHSHLNPKAGRSVLYTIRYHEVRFPFIARSRVITEKALLALNPQHVWVEATRWVAAKPAVNLSGLNDFFLALAVQALIELGQHEYTVIRLMTDELDAYIDAAMKAGLLLLKQDILGEIPSAPGRGVHLARSPLYWAWAVQS